jgi:hypothetical protein
MDLSKSAKKKRDAVEGPLFLTQELIEDLEEVRTRVDATMKVWHETSRTLHPALIKLDARLKDVNELHEKLAILWKQGAARMWKEL